MNEEKKLDEKTLEGVTGGNDQWEFSEDEGNFIVANCIGYCAHEGLGDCPYGDKHTAFAQVGKGNPCPMQKLRDMT